MDEKEFEDMMKVLGERLPDASLLQELKEDLVNVLISDEHLDYTTNLTDAEVRDFAFVKYLARRWHIDIYDEYLDDIKRNKPAKFGKRATQIVDIIKATPPVEQGRRGILSRLRGGHH